jgi:hypothetical protein
VASHADFIFAVERAVFYGERGMGQPKKVYKNIFFPKKGNLRDMSDRSPDSN